MDFRHPYLSRQIIAYIGNKRRLLPLICQALRRIYGPVIPRGMSFADPFAGSGVVSRLAKLLGFQVFSNDWEPYALTIGRAYLETNARDIPLLFGSDGQFAELLEHLNTLPDPPPEEQYVARYYAPAAEDPEQADYRKERLFYTRQNALRIDRIRNEIDRLFPPASGLPQETQRKRELLIALLLYEAATHTNTSGVFKAYHRGFGGHGKDALGRILKPIHLEPPPLIDSEAPCEMRGQEAAAFFRSLDRSFDVVYLDPPYNQHQYGSNYHLLNTIVLWDRVPVPQEIGPNGRLRDKAGIRKDWKRTRSAYCYRDTAVAAFSELLERIDAEHLLLSYSTDGIIPFSTLKEICASQGQVSILANDYVTYRGGKQSNHRKDWNLEFLLWVRKGKSLSRKASPNGWGAPTDRDLDPPGLVPASPRLDAPVGLVAGEKVGGEGEETLERVLKYHRLRLLSRAVYRPEAVREFFQPQEGARGLYQTQFSLGGRRVTLSFRYLIELEGEVDTSPLSLEELTLLADQLAVAACRTRREEVDAYLAVLPYLPQRDQGKYSRKLLKVLRKLAHRKYKELFWEAWEQAFQISERLRNGSPENRPVQPVTLSQTAYRRLGPVQGDRFHEELVKIRTVAELRFADRRE